MTLDVWWKMLIEKEGQVVWRQTLTQKHKEWGVRFRNLIWSSSKIPSECGKICFMAPNSNYKIHSNPNNDIFKSILN